MSANIKQVFIANAITTVADADLLYVGQSPFGAGNDAAITFENFKAQFALSSGAFTNGSVIFANASNELTQDNNELFWDDSNKRLGIGKTDPDHSIDVTGNISADGALLGGTKLAVFGYVAPTMPGAFVFYDRTSTGQTTFGNQRGASSGGWEWANYNTSNSVDNIAMSLSSNGALIVTGDLSNSNYTQGSVLFAGESGVVSQANTSFFWDNTNARLGVGTQAPTNRLHVLDAVTGVFTAARFQNAQIVNIGNYCDVILNSGPDQTFGTTLRTGPGNVNTNKYQVYVGNGNSTTESLVWDTTNASGSLSNAIKGNTSVTGTLDSSSSVTAQSFCKAVAFSGTNGQGAHLGWNRDGFGEMVFANQRGTGGGGWSWLPYDNDNTPQTTAMFLTRLGNLSISGSLTKASGTFTIDHPLDPENKILQHSFVESPDMMNVYNGTAICDTTGDAIVNLPDYFEALNIEFKYQLTCIGAHAPVYIAQEIENNQFTIAGGVDGLKVSWQVTGIRNDRFAQDNRVQVELDKKPGQLGTYLHPRCFGVDEGENELRKTSKADL